jgi:hypothetical protein
MTTARKRPRRRRERGTIDDLPSGALRVRVEGGLDPITKKRHRLIEIIPPGTPNAADVAEKARTRLLHQVDERRHPRTNATVNQMLDRYLDQHHGERSTLRTYRGYVDRHVRPLIGKLKAGGEVDADVLDSLYAELRRCRDHCTGRKVFEHRTKRPHECDATRPTAGSARVFSKLNSPTLRSRAERGDQGSSCQPTIGGRASGLRPAAPQASSVPARRIDSMVPSGRLS